MTFVPQIRDHKVGRSTSACLARFALNLGGGRAVPAYGLAAFHDIDGQEPEDPIGDVLGGQTCHACFRIPVA